MNIAVCKEVLRIVQCDTCRFLEYTPTIGHFCILKDYQEYTQDNCPAWETRKNKIVDPMVKDV
jgi:hypothetical protein